MILLLWILIQIIGESLPISSSGHVVLMQKILLQHFENAWVIDFLLHGPTIIILFVYFLSVWKKMILQQTIVDAIRFIIITDLITFCCWLLNFSGISIIANYFLPIGFCVTALCLYLSRYAKGDKLVRWSTFDAIVLGTVQGLCLLPGISRFACTYGVGIWLGYSRKNSFALSFLIQIPLLCAAFAKGFFVVLRQPEIWKNFMHGSIILTFMIASLISYKLFCWVARLIEQNRLWYFAFYMMIPIFMSFWVVKDVVL